VPLLALLNESVREFRVNAECHVAAVVAIQVAVNQPVLNELTVIKFLHKESAQSGDRAVPKQLFMQIGCGADVLLVAIIERDNHL